MLRWSLADRTAVADCHACVRVEKEGIGQPVVTAGNVEVVVGTVAVVDTVAVVVDTVAAAVDTAAADQSSVRTCFQAVACW